MMTECTRCGYFSFEDDPINPKCHRCGNMSDELVDLMMSFGPDATWDIDGTVTLTAESFQKWLDCHTVAKLDGVEKSGGLST